MSTSMENFRSQLKNSYILYKLWIIQKLWTCRILKDKNQLQYFIEKIKSSRVQNWKLSGNLPRYTFMQNLLLKAENIIKSRVKHPEQIDDIDLLPFLVKQQYTKDMQCLLHHDIQHICPYVSMQASSNTLKTSDVFVIMTYSKFVHMSLQSSSNILKTSNVFVTMTYSTFVYMSLQSSSIIQKTSNIFVITTYSTFVYMSLCSQAAIY